MAIQGSEQLHAIFGRWPSFHDAEVLRFTLDRGGSGDVDGPTAECVIHVFEMTSEVDPRGYYVLKNHVLVTLRFLDVTEVELHDFNHQNVLQGLWIQDISDRQLERVKFHVSFPASYGLGGELKCYAIVVVSVVPCDADGNAISA